MVRFVQFGDTHLDSYISGAMGLSKEQTKALMSDVRTAFTKACALAVERRADIVLIPGDVFDYETASADTARFMQQALADIAPIPVFIAPGNHDSLRARSPYNEPWPPNVHIFRSTEFETLTAEEIGCSITGMGHAHRGIRERLSAIRVPHSDTPISILLFHGSRDSYRPSEKETVIPFSDAELLAQNFTYTAIGHYHSYSEISDGRCVRGAYSGCVQGRGLDEIGMKCVLVGEISPEGTVELEKVEVAERRIVRIEADVTGCRDSAEVFARMDAAVSGQVRPCDVGCVFLKGMLAPGVELDTTEWESRQSMFAVSVNTSSVEPDYDLDFLSRESTASSIKAMFVRKMLERQRTADEQEQRAIQDAIYYGLYALDGRKLEPRDAN